MAFSVIVTRLTSDPSILSTVDGMHRLMRLLVRLRMPPVAG